MLPIAHAIAFLLSVFTLVAALSGDTQCQDAMCVTAIVNDTTTVTYELKVSVPNIGWAGIAFGSTMVNSPMVVLYKNSSGLVTVSQRSTLQYVEPAVDNNPPRAATAFNSLSSFTDSSTVMAFTIPVNADKTQTIGWAFSTDPVSGDQLPYHANNKGVLTLDLTKSISTGNAPTPGSSTGSSNTTPLTSNEMILVAHGVILAIAFMIILPAGSLLARLARTYTNNWFFGHWVLQFGIGAPLVLVGTVLAIYEVGATGKPHFSPGHKQLGLAVFILYIVQISLGGIIHFIKPKRAARRPIQNYIHAILGLAVIAVSFYQVYTGMMKVWPAVTGRITPNGYYLFWAIWVILLPVAYSAGLALLPRQFTQERIAQERKTISLRGAYNDSTDSYRMEEK